MPRKMLKGATISGHLAITPESWAKFQRSLKELEKAARKEILKQAVLAGGAVVEGDANQRAPGPNIVHDIEKVTDRNATAVVGPDAKHWYYRFTELGATPHDISGRPVLAFEGEEGLVITRAVKQAGGMPARPFLRPAMESKSEAAQRAMADVLESEMKRAAK